MASSRVIGEVGPVAMPSCFSGIAAMLTPRSNGKAKRRTHEVLHAPSIRVVAVVDHTTMLLAVVDHMSNPTIAE